MNDSRRFYFEAIDRFNDYIDALRESNVLNYAQSQRLRSFGDDIAEQMFSKAGGYHAATSMNDDDAR